MSEAACCRFGPDQHVHLAQYRNALYNWIYHSHAAEAWTLCDVVYKYRPPAVDKQDAEVSLSAGRQEHTTLIGCSVAVFPSPLTVRPKT